MVKSIRHLRADECEWKANDIVIPDGEIAILKTKAGNAKIKIGNGEKKFSELPSLLGDIGKTEEGVNITLLHANSYRLGERTALSISFPDVIDDDYYSEISFDSGVDATEFTVYGRLRLTGDGVADEDFMPIPNTHYTIFIWYDGSMQGIVRGLPNA